MKTIVVVVNKNNFIYPFLEEDIEISNFYKFVVKNKFLNRIIKILFLLFKCIHLYQFCFGEWYYKLKKENYNVVFFDECGIDKSLIKIINKNKNKCAIYMWNPAKYVKNHKLYAKIKARIFSFDPKDSSKYGYFYKPCLIPDRYLSSLKCDSSYDLVFIGLNKGRRKYIEKINSLCDGMKNYIRIIDEYSVGTVYPISYAENLYYISKCRANIEWLQIDQYGETMRTVECLMLGKKMITNNQGIYSLPYYNPNDFLVIENINEIDYKKINEFLGLEYIKYNINNLRDRFPKKWLLSFFEGGHEQ